MAENLIKIPAKKKGENLKQRAFLNSVTSIIDYAGVQLVGFFVSPFIVRGLGSEIYGVWQMLSQMTGFANMADTRASQVLKWSVAQKRDTYAGEILRKEVTSALLITIFILPIVLIMGGVIIWYAPYLTNVDESLYGLIRSVCGILMFALVINKVFDLFESVLRGMNLGFKRMGVRAGIVAFGGGLKVWVILQGYGIIGLSLIEVFLSLATGITFYYIVKAHVPWFGFGKTDRKSLVAYGKLSGWFMAFTGSKMFLLGSDKIILGYLSTPVYVTQYTITMFASLALQGIISAVVNGVIPGIGSLFGQQHFEKVKQARKLIANLNWLIVFSIGTSILLLNHSFIQLWMGQDYFAGNIENFLIILIALQFVFFQTDSFIINVSLELKEKVMFSIISSVVTFLLALWLVPVYQILGLCISILLGRMVLTIGYPIILKNKMSERNVFSFTHIRPFTVSLLVFIGANYAGQYVSISDWLSLLGSGGAVILIAGILFWIVGFNAGDRNETAAVLAKIKLFKSK
ncbi:lipopolysaccharide biosynthesis protein [Negadavirga shengliensis]|uniref:Lipopolysaccharide biosynthesis protein n=1 Tax=Negadavirga shengliensis TaxID=1389218 RepID=A0ABV9T374_9BACT